MLCTTCRRSLQARLPLFRNHLPLSPRRFVATAPSNPNAAPIDPPPPSSSSNAAAPIIRKPAVSGASKPRVKEKARSSVAGGEVLKGLGYTKAKPQILAMEDEEYPAWLWGVLDESASVSGEGVAAPTRKQRIKASRKQSKLSKDIPLSIPVHEQSKNLTVEGDDAVVSLERRNEIVKSSRVARRKGIREDNFLRGL